MDNRSLPQLSVFNKSFDHVQCPWCGRSKLAMEPGEERICPMCGRSFKNLRRLSGNAIFFSGSNPDFEKYLNSTEFVEDFKKYFPEKAGE